MIAPAMGKNLNNISLEYLVFMDERDNLLVDFDISFKEVRLLRYILFSYMQDRVSTVNDILPLSYLGSPSTNHTLLKRLVKKKFVLSIQSNNDQRVKNLVPSDKALQLFEQISTLFRTHREELQT